jgi:HPt (histidine-containing phosphotransfer) domain-containing protein
LLARWLGEGKDREGLDPRVVTASNVDDVGEAAVDSAAFKRLAETMEDELPSLIEDFLQTTAQMLKVMAHAGGQSDLQLVQREAHTLKSSAAMVGAMRLAALAAALEASIHSGTTVHPVISAEQMLAEFDRVRAELATLASVNGGVAHV